MKIQFQAINLLVVVALSFLILSSIAQAKEKTFGGAEDDAGYAVQETKDGGLIIVGETASLGAGSSDVYLVRIDSLRRVTDSLGWVTEKTFGGIEDDVGYSVQQTEDGGFIIVGKTSSFGAGGSDVYLIKTDALGNKKGEKTFGGIEDDVGYSVQQTEDGGFIIVGKTSSLGAGGSDVYLIKTDALGNADWEKTFGGAEDDVGYSVQQTEDGGFIIVGKTSSLGAGGSDVYLIKTDALGNADWEKTFGGIEDDAAYSVQQTKDGGYIIAGETASFGAGKSDVYLIKTDASGNIEPGWPKTFGGAEVDIGRSVRKTGDGYIIAGSTESFSAGKSDVYLIKTDALGNKKGEEILGGANSDGGFAVQQTRNGNYIVAGSTESFGAGKSDVYLYEFSSIPNNKFEHIPNFGVRMYAKVGDSLYSTIYYSLKVNRGEHIFILLDMDSSIYTTTLSIKEGGLPETPGNKSYYSQAVELTASRDGYCYVRVGCNYPSQGSTFSIIAHNENTFPTLTKGQVLDKQKLKAYDSLWYQVPVRNGEHIFALLDKDCSSTCLTYLSIKEGGLPETPGNDYDFDSFDDQAVELTASRDGYCYVQVTAGENITFSITAHNENTFPTLTKGQVLDNQKLKAYDSLWYQIPVKGVGSISSH
jgi:hypothetical protein